MITRNAAEQVYCFLHQKYRVYEYSNSESQRDDIEYAISSFVDQLSPELYELLSEGDNSFLKEHTDFSSDMIHAMDKLSNIMEA